MIKKLLLTLCLFIISFLIGYFFWNQEIKYQLPTPVPDNYHPISFGEKVNLENNFSSSKPILLHFFNPDCPCSKFNITHFNELTLKYKSKVDFYVIVKSDEENIEIEKIKNEFLGEVKIINDSNNVISDKCGVYSTPQAALLDKDKNLYYRGNYNKSRYCVLPESDYVQIAINSLLDNKKLPVFEKSAVTAYGCAISKK